MNSARTERLNSFKIKCNVGSSDIKGIISSLQIDLPNIYEIYRNKMYDIDDEFKKYDVDFFNPEDKNADLLYSIINYYLNSLIKLSLVSVDILFKDYFHHGLIRKLKPMDNDKLLDKVFGSYIAICNSLQNKSVDKTLEASILLVFDKILLTGNYGAVKTSLSSIDKENIIINMYNSHQGKTREEFLYEYLENEDKKKK